MKKRLGLLLAAFLLATTATLVSCDSGEKNDNNDPTNQTPPAVETPVEGNQFVVTFETSGGSIVAPITVKEGEKVTKPADPTKTGHLFAGWKKNGEVFDFETPITESITLTASWAKEKFTITVNLNNGQDPIIVENVPYGTKLSDVNISLENVDKEGYSLSGIMLGENAATGEELVEGNMTLDVIWTPREYSATIIRANGREEAITFTADNKATVLDNIRLTQSTSDYVYAWSSPLPMELELEDGAVFQEMQSISTVEQFLALNGQTGYYFLAADIDFGGQVFTSNSVPVESFAGTLEGNGYSVKNLTFKAADVPQQGVFKKLSGTIRNMGFENITMSGWMNMHGWSGIVAKNADGATFENIYISGSMELVNAVDCNWEGGNYTGWGLVSGFLASSADNATVNNVFCDVKYKSGTDISCVAGKGTVNLGDYIFNGEYGTLNNWGSYKNDNAWQGVYNGDAASVMLAWPTDVWDYNGIGNPSLKENCVVDAVVESGAKKVIISTNEGGSVSKDAPFIYENDKLTLTFTPAEKYALSSVLVNGVEKVGQVVNNQLQLTVTQDVNITVVFALTNFVIDFESDVEYSVSGASNVAVGKAAIQPSAEAPGAIATWWVQVKRNGSKALSFNVGENATATVKIKLSEAHLQALAESKTIKLLAAGLMGTGNGSVFTVEGQTINGNYGAFPAWSEVTLTNVTADADGYISFKVHATKTHSFFAIDDISIVTANNAA